MDVNKALPRLANYDCDTNTTAGFETANSDDVHPTKDGYKMINTAWFQATKDRCIPLDTIPPSAPADLSVQ